MTNLKMSQKVKPNTMMIGEYTEEYLLQRANEIIKERTADWETCDQVAEDRIPRFHSSELQLGKVCGKGGFFVVSEITNISLKYGNSVKPDPPGTIRTVGDGSSSNDEDEDDFEEHSNDSEEEYPIVVMKKSTDEDYISSVVQDRHFMQLHCKRDGKDCRYVYKIMQRGCRKDPETFVNTVVDLAIEAKFLAVVRHPHIIKMRAMCVGEVAQSNFFIVLDKLYGTLTDKLKKQWLKQKQHGASIVSWFDIHKQKKENEFLAERLTVAYDIASALAYLHDLNIIYRDLKPDNIGFDVRDDVKLFDFGLATEFDPEKARENKAYKLTGDTGTARYMAPEVALDEHYSETADVYSFSIILWQILSLEVPYGSNVPDEVVERKVLYCGARPKIEQSWAPGIRRLLHDCFASKPRRPLMKNVMEVLATEINKISHNKIEMDDQILNSARSEMSVQNFCIDC